jgi:hypothetical protein
MTDFKRVQPLLELLEFVEFVELELAVEAKALPSACSSAIEAVQ